MNYPTVFKDENTTAKKLFNGELFSTGFSIEERKMNTLQGILADFRRVLKIYLVVV